MSLIDFARHELSLIGGQDDKMQREMNKCVLDIVEMFSEQGHSGFSAAYAIGMLEKVLQFKPLSPLTGEDDEWNDIRDMSAGDILYQNRRCPTVFKDEYGAYDINGKVFREPSGACFTSRDSRVAVVFPYTPKVEYVDVGEDR